MGGLILDLFAGPGGWSEGLRPLGLADVGIEWDAAACQTRSAAGHATIRADVAQYPTAPFAGRVEGLIASPPCQAFSRAGKRKGLSDPRGQLVWEVVRWAKALRPEWIACEQVPDVLPIWRYIALELMEQGWTCWTGLLHAEQYGVPQTRERAFLMAHRTRTPQPPEPTHQRYEPGVVARASEGGMFGGAVLPWVSMAEALGWGMTERPALTLAPGCGSGGPDLVGGSGARKVLHGEIARGAWAWDRPATTVACDPRVSPPNHHDDGKQGKNPVSSDDLRRWAWERPATTVVGSFKPEIIAAPGYRTTTSRQDAAGSIKTTVEERLVLQGFRSDYPVQGGETKKSEQVGNAVCPPLAAAVIGELVGIDWRERREAAA